MVRAHTWVGCDREVDVRIPAERGSLGRADVFPLVYGSQWVHIAPHSPGVAGTREWRVDKIARQQVTIDPGLEELVRTMQTLNDKTTEAVFFLRDRLTAISALRVAYWVQRYDEAHLWAFVEGSRLLGQQDVVHEACEAMVKFPGISITCHVLPASATDDATRPGDAVSLVER